MVMMVVTIIKLIFHSY